MTTTQSIHWFAVGKISDLARIEVERTGGQVVQLHSDPAVTLVGIAHAGLKDLALTNASEITIETFESELHLVWLSTDQIINAAYSSLTETELITYQEYEARLMDMPTDLPSYTGIDADAPTYYDVLDPDNLDDHPF